jgi:glycerol-3-phosphate dehydrogenase (NAD(P)+)
MGESMMQIAVLGSGSWATALVKILCDNSSPKHINWWIRSSEKVAYMRQHGHNPDYISSVELHLDQITLSNNLEEIISSSGLIILAIPSAFIHDVFSLLDPSIFKGKDIVSAVKGLIPETHQILGEYLGSRYKMNNNNIGVITGPCHAEEVAFEKLSYLTVASESEALVTSTRNLLANRYINTVPSDDIYGTEYSAVLKNIYAIAAGIFHGMGYGDNFLAVLISNAIRETKRFISVVHPIDRDIKDSAYLGDLMVTAYSQFSRNRTFGNMLGKGYSVQSAQLEMNMVAEGYYATKSIYQINAQYQVDMPILEFVYQVVYGGEKPRRIAKSLTDILN